MVKSVQKNSIHLTVYGSAQIKSPVALSLKIVKAGMLTPESHELQLNMDRAFHASKC